MEFIYFVYSAHHPWVFFVQYVFLQHFRMVGKKCQFQGETLAGHVEVVNFKSLN